MSFSDPNTPVVINHGFKGVYDVVNYPTKFWNTAKKYSINGTIPAVAFNTFAQFSLAYLAAIMITRNDLSFITNILDARVKSLYTLVSLILVAVFLASVALRYIYNQTIKDEKEINENIRGGYSDGINEIPQNALTIEIIPNFNDKEPKNFSIIVPISGKQGTILTKQREENGNRIILLTAPYVISGLMIAGALAGFGFSNINGWLEISIISLAVVIAIVGTLVTLNNLKNNKANQQLNIVTKPGNSNIIPFVNVLIPFSNSRVAYVMENKVEINEENDPITKIARKIGNQLCNIADKKLQKVVDHFNGSTDEFLKVTGNNIKTLLDNLEKGIKKNVDGVENTANHAIAFCLQDISKNVNALCKEVSKDVEKKFGEVNINKIMNLIDVFKKKIEKYEPSYFIGKFKSDAQHNQDEVKGDVKNNDAGGKQPKYDHNSNKETYFGANENWTEEVEIIGQLRKDLEALKRELSEEKNRQAQSETAISPEASSITSADSHQDEEEEVDKKQRIINKEKEFATLNESLSKQKETDEWQEKINGSPQEFLHYILDYIKLKVGENETSLRNFDNKIMINWKDRSQTTCYINKQGDFQKIEPGTNVSFVNSNVQEIYKHVFPGQEKAPAA